MIELVNVCKAFEGKPVLAHVSHAFPDGSVTELRGASGSGKTTLLGILLGLIKPDSGQALNIPQALGAVFQEDRLIEHWDAVSNVRLACGKDVSDAEIVEHLTQLGLGDDLDKRVSEFSGGMRRRVALCRALLAKPVLLVLDEPFKGLDRDALLAAAGYVNRHRNGATIIIATHDSEEARLLGAAGEVTLGTPASCPQ